MCETPSFASDLGLGSTVDGIGAALALGFHYVSRLLEMAGFGAGQGSSHVLGGGATQYSQSCRLVNSRLANEGTASSN